jgi:hypothetical protein
MRRSPLGLTSVGSREKVPSVGDGMGRSIVSHNLVHLPFRKGSRARRALNRVHDRTHPSTIH